MRFLGNTGRIVSIVVTVMLSCGLATAADDHAVVDAMAVETCVQSLPATWRSKFRTGQRGSHVMPRRIRKRWGECASLQRLYTDTLHVHQLRDALLTTLSESQRLDAAHEAEAIALQLVATTRDRAQHYRMVGSPLFNNALIKTGVRSEGGYCYHWTRDLVTALQSVPTQYYVVQWAVAAPGQVTENNAVLLTARAGAVESGLVYDAWRGAGKPFWRLVRDDHYDWAVRFTEKNLKMGLADAIR